jgi:dephospho-CoA kinase
MISSNHIGLTGGIGSGKSTVAALWVELGARLVDTDAIARSLTAQGGAALPALAKAFGANIFAADGALDRDRMRALVFSDAAQRQRLEGILHPMISAEAAAQAAAAGTEPVVFDVPLLSARSPWRERVGRIVVVDCSAETQVQRVMQRNGWTAETVNRVIAQQITREQRRRLADAVIVNDSIGLDALRVAARDVWAWCMA